MLEIGKLEADLEVSILELYYSTKSFFCEYEKGGVYGMVASETMDRSGITFLLDSSKNSTLGDVLKYYVFILKEIYRFFSLFKV